MSYRFLLLTFSLFFFVGAVGSLSAQVRVGQTKEQALKAIQGAGGVVAVNDKNYIEATNFTKPILNNIIPERLVFYSNTSGLIYSIVYLLKTADDRNVVAKMLAKLPFSGDKLVSANENSQYLQLLLNEEGSYVFILMDTVIAKRDAPDDYAVLKKTVQAWQGIAATSKATLLGLTTTDLKKLATGSVRYQGNRAEGLLVSKGQKVEGYTVEEVQVVFDASGKVIQSIWLFKDRSEWTRFLSNEGRGADLLLQAEPAMQQALLRGETIDYQLDDNTLFRFWADRNGFGVAFGDKAALS